MIQYSLKKLRDFFKKKATEYKIPVSAVDASVNYLRHTPTVCSCVECQESSHLTVSNSIVHPAEIFLMIEKAIFALNIPEMKEQIQHFHQVKCRQAKNVIAAYIIDSSIKHCTNSSEMQLSNASLLMTRMFISNLKTNRFIFCSKINLLSNQDK